MEGTSPSLDQRFSVRESRIPTGRENHIIGLVAEGLTNKAIADAIGTTEHVVKNYLRVIYDKLGVWNRTELALWKVSREDHHAIADTVSAARPSEL